MADEAHGDHLEDAFDEEYAGEANVQVVKYLVPLRFITDIVFIIVFFRSQAQRVGENARDDKPVEPNVDDDLNAELA